jgi:hypothetical protein
MIVRRGLRARHPIGRCISLCSSLFCPGRGFSAAVTFEGEVSNTTTGCAEKSVVTYAW